MQWRAHILIGIFLVFAIFYLLGNHDIIFLLLISLFGGLTALVPDLDHDSSKGRKILDAAIILFALLAAYLHGCGGRICLPGLGGIVSIAIIFFAIVGIYFVLFKLFKPKHRGITHTIVANLVFAIFLYLIFGFTMALAGFIGYFSHLLADQHIKLI